MTALTHVVVGTNDLERARDFYDATLATLGLRRLKDYEGRASIWGAERHEFTARPISWPSGSPGFMPNMSTIVPQEMRTSARRSTPP